MTDHDRLFKELLTTFFPDFIKLFVPQLFGSLDPSSLVFLDKEIFTDVTAGEAHRADLVVRARLKQDESFFLVHVEAQADKQASFGKRMFRYFARLHEKHDLPVYPIALFSFDSPRTPQPSIYSVHLPNFKVLSFRYHVIQLNRLPWHSYLGCENPVAAALMAKMQFASRDKASVKLECLGMNSRLALDRARSNLISGFVDTYLRLNKSEQEEFETKLYSLDAPQREEIMEIVTSWMEEGQLKELRSVIIRLLSQRFGDIEESLRMQINSTALEKLEKLVDNLLKLRSIDEVKKFLE